MAVVTVGELIDKAGAFEERLERYYADLRDRATNDGVRLVTYYLSRRKRHLPDTIRSCSPGQLEGIRRTPFKYEDHDLDLQRCFEGRELPADADADSLLAIAIEFVEHLIRFYRQMTSLRLGVEVEQFFENLLRIEEKDVVELKKIRATHYF